jgi:hypothetical protein
MTETLFDTENPNIKLGFRVNGNQLEHFKQVTSTTGEEMIDENTTEETVTITRTILTLI